MRRSLMVGLAAVVLVASDAPDRDMGQLKGRWYGGVLVYNGVPTLIVDRNDPSIVLDITDRTATLRTRNQTAKCWSSSLLEKASPKAINLCCSEGPDKGKTQRAIYKIEPNHFNGVYLTLCFARPGADRPSQFLYKPEEGQLLYVFTR
jgi:uncharacterized protein (TIGR03067 family)